MAKKQNTSNYINKKIVEAEIKEACRMLKAINIPVMRAEGIKLERSKKGFRYLANVRRGPNNTFIICLCHHFMRKPYAEYPNVKRERMSVLMHELVHTCYDENLLGHWLNKHNERFLHYADMIWEAYGYNITGTSGVTDICNLEKEPLLAIACTKCPDTTVFYKKEDAERYKRLAEEGRVICQYCDSPMVVKEDKTVAPLPRPKPRDRVY